MGTIDHRIQVAGEDIILMPERAAFWPARRTLLVADLHLGKAETYQSCGLPLPGDAVSGEQLRRLGRAARRVDAARVLILGDLLHAPAGLTEPMLEQVGTALDGLHAEVCLVTGNHDRRLDRVLERWPLRHLGPEQEEGPFRFVHDPAVAGDSRYTWAGHLHPAIAFGGRADRLKLPCFVVGGQRTILPAFSRFAAGGAIPLEPADSIFAIGDDEVFPMPSPVAGTARSLR